MVIATDSNLLKLKRDSKNRNEGQKAVRLTRKEGNGKCDDGQLCDLGNLPRVFKYVSEIVERYKYPKL